MALSFATKRKRTAGSWRDDQQQQQNAQGSSSSSVVFGELKKELAERERTKAQRKRELEAEAKIIARTREFSESLSTVVLMDVEAGSASGRMIFELFEDVAPRTVKNFVTLANDERYDGTLFYKIEPGVACSGGDYERNDGTAGRSTYGRDFEHENYTLKHTDAGVLATVGRTVNSKFQIIFAEQPAFDGRQVVFGRLVDGFAILREIEKASSARILKCASVPPKGGSRQATVEAYAAPLHLPKPKDDPKHLARSFRNKANYYDNSTRSALFSWTTSC
ncbi:hypothetical protein CTAYLR_004019 [Chrysophaeum taylorii]|uniref:Peptidyl-prolyl cis-trans isomerase n=1 Tax=Chrysophaeum taylorii TaxID=2483200 RepID=A0AAD7U7T3_9STRA|nr:hypothetical protein CTAYLR_004019 [Chrysophaeum taylorii]